MYYLRIGRVSRMCMVTDLRAGYILSGRFTSLASAWMVMSGSKVPIIFQLVHGLYHVSVTLLGSCPMMTGIHSVKLLISSPVVLILILSSLEALQMAYIFVVFLAYLGVVGI